MYQIAVIPKRNGKKRTLEIPDDKLKLRQRRILDRFLNDVPTPCYAHGFKKHRSPVTNAKVHEGAALIVKLDIKDFFRHCTKKKVKPALKRAFKSQKLIQYILDNTFVDDHLPTGAPTSPALANICMKTFDKSVYGMLTFLPSSVAGVYPWAHPPTIKYTRYADDITVSVHTKMKLYPAYIDGLKTNIINGIRNKLKKYGFRLNDRKTRAITNKSRMVVTGLTVNTRACVSKEYRKKIRAAIHSAETENDFKSIEGKIAWVQQTSPSQANKLASLLYLKRSKMQSSLPTNTT